MTVKLSTDANNKLIATIEAEALHGGLVYYDSRIRIYNRSGYVTDIYLLPGANTKTLEMETGFRSYFIDNCKKQGETGYVRFEHEHKRADWLGGDWSVGAYEDDKIEIYYTIAPDLSMSLSYFDQINGYNMVGSTYLQAAFTTAFKYGATMSSCTLSVEGKSYNAPYRSDILKQGGYQKVTANLTDSRGCVATVEQTIWVMANMPSLDAISGNTYLNSEINYTYTPPNKDAYSRLSVACKVGDSYVDVENINLGQSSGRKNGNLSLTKLGDFYNKYPNTTAVPLRFTLQTYQDAYSTKLKEEYSRDLTLYIPDNADTKPQISAVDITSYPVLLGDSSLFIKSKNGAVVNSTWAGRYNATIRNVIWVTETETFANGAASDAFTTFGQVAINIRATDSRGFTNNASYNITVQDYSPPYVSTIAGAERYIVRRSDENGDVADDGTYLRVELGKRWTSLGGKNKCKLLTRKRSSGKDWESNYTTLLAENSPSDDYSGTLNEGLNPTLIYTIEIVAEDSLGERDTYYATIPTEKVYMERSGTRGSISFGGRVQYKDSFEVYQTAYLHAGVIVNFGGGAEYALMVREDGTVYVDKTQLSMEV